MDSAMSCIITLSVISITRHSGGEPASRGARARPRRRSRGAGAVGRRGSPPCGAVARRDGRCKMLTLRGRPPGAPRHRSGTMRPVSSASGTKSSGVTRPRVGWFHRTSASNPSISPVSQHDDRLVVQDELVVVDRPLQVGLRARAGAARCRASPARRPGSGPSPLLSRCTSRRRRSAAAPPRPRVRSARPIRRSRSRCSRERTPLSLRGGTARRAPEDPRRRPSAAPTPRSVLEQDRELVASEPGRRCRASAGRSAAARRPRRAAGRRPRGRASR